MPNIAELGIKSNLVSCGVAFPSCLDGNSGTIKMDAFCMADLNLNSKRITACYKILDFDTLREMTILWQKQEIISHNRGKPCALNGPGSRGEITLCFAISRVSLLADKCTTMTQGMIGLKPARQTEMAKRIYDMAVLLRSTSRDDLEAAYDAYVKMTGFRVASLKRYPPYLKDRFQCSRFNSWHAEI